MRHKTLIQSMNSVITALKVEDKDGNETLSLTAARINSAASDIRSLMKRLGLTTDQVILFSAIMEKSSTFRLEQSDLAEFMGLSYLEFLQYTEDLKVLSDKWLIRIKADRNNIRVPDDVIKTITNDSVYVRPGTEWYTTLGVLKRFKKLVKLREDNEIEYNAMATEMDNLIQDNPDTSIGSAMRKYGVFGEDKKLPRDERVAFYLLCYRYFSEDDDMVGWHDFEDCFGEDNEDGLDMLKADYSRESLCLQTQGLIEYSARDGVKSKDFFKIKDSIKEEIFREVGGVRKPQATVAGTIDYKAIKEKKLFYGEEEGRKVGTLRGILAEERYAQVKKALSDKGMRTGFTCLFYGSPGTGKTETVYQLARETGRMIVSVDVSRIKDCFVGESEKTIKGLFDSYRSLVSASDVAPILLFNEADAIFGVRKEGATSAVDKMENSIQNIILQEMENLDGILIATTNLTDNLDKAFERRFLYKIRFGRPSVEARAKIWASMIPELSAEEALSLSENYDLSGGQIENICRKRTVQSILNGVDPTFEEVKAFCDDENISSAKVTRKIGF